MSNPKAMRWLAWISDLNTFRGRFLLAMVIVAAILAATTFGNWLGEKIAVTVIEGLQHVDTRAGSEGATLVVAVGIMLFLTIIASLVVSQRGDDGAARGGEMQQLGEALLGLYVAVGRDVVLRDGGNVNEQPEMVRAREALAAAGLIEHGDPEVKNA